MGGKIPSRFFYERDWKDSGNDASKNAQSFAPKPFFTSFYIAHKYLGLNILSY